MPYGGAKVIAERISADHRHNGVPDGVGVWKDAVGPKQIKLMEIASELGDRYKAALVSEVIGVLAGAALIVFLARLLDPESYGRFFLVISIFSVARLFSVFGISRSASRFLSEYKETDISQIPFILRDSLIMTMIVTSIVAVVLVLGRAIISETIGVVEISEYLALGGIYIIFITLATYCQNILQGLERIRAASFLMALDKVGRGIFAVGLVILGLGVVGALVGYIMGYVIVATLGLIYIFFKFYYSIPHTYPDPGLRQKLARYSIPIAITQSAHSLDNEVDRILIGFFVGPIGVAFYTLGQQVVQFVETPMAALGFTLSPVYQSHEARGKSDTAAHLYETALSHGLLVYIPAATGVVLLAQPGVEILFGSEYDGAAPVLQVFAIFIVLQSITKITSDGLDYLGRARERASIKVGTAIMNFILNIILIPLIGVIGAAIATVVTYAFYTLGNLIIMYFEIQFNVHFVLKHAVSAVLISMFMSFTILNAIDLTPDIHVLVLATTLGATIWLISVLTFGLIDIDIIVEWFS